MLLHPERSQQNVSQTSSAACAPCKMLAVMEGASHCRHLGKHGGGEAVREIVKDLLPVSVGTADDCFKHPAAARTHSARRTELLRVGLHARAEMQTAQGATPLPIAMPVSRTPRS